MKISALRLFNVKRFAGRGVAIENVGDGVNVLCAANEFGKSTSFEALHALFFHRHSSVAGDIKSLRPYGGGNPLVEADISTEEGRFRITKQFLGGQCARVTDIASGRLVAQADEAENFIGNLIKGGAAGPAGLIWVRQGVTGIEKRSRSEEDGERQVRANLLEAVQGEVEAITGGRRMAEIMQATEEALSEFITAKGRPKSGGRYAMAIADRARLAAEESRLLGEVSALRAALDERTTITRRLAELDTAEGKRERRQATEKAQAAFDAAKAHGDKLKAAEKDLTVARERRDAANGEFKAFRSALEKAVDLNARLREAERRRDEESQRRSDAIAAVEQADAKADAAEADVQEMRRVLARLDAALKAREASEQHGRLVQQLNEAEELRRAIEQGEASLALVAIPADAIGELRKLEIEIEKLRALEETARPSVSVAYEAGASATVTMDGNPLADGEARSYNRQARLAVPGLGTIMLRSNRPAPTDAGLHKAEATRQTLLASMGADSLSQAEERQVRAQQVDRELQELRGRLSSLAPKGLTHLRQEVAACQPAGDEVLELKADPAQVGAALAEAEERRKLARLAQKEAGPQRATADEAFIAAKTAVAALDGERTGIEATLGPRDKRGERERILGEALGECERAVAMAEAHVDGLRAAVFDLASAEAALNRARSVEEGAEKEIGRLREALAGLNGTIAARSDEAVEEKWRETVERLSAAQADVEAYGKEVAVLQRLSSALETARSDARDLYLKPVMTELKPLLGLLFDDISIIFDEKTLLPQSISRNGLAEEVDRLSGGMREQLSVLTRLAFARLLAQAGRPAPVILDDALVYSDDDRIEKMFDALHRQSKDQQVIVFSCRQRAFQQLGGNTLHMVEWIP